MVKLIPLILLLSVVVSLPACESRLFTIHKIDVQQGNAIEAEKVDQLKVGMDKNQVKFLMGSPLITDVFHPDRWDYIYFLIPDYGTTERYHLSIFFEGDKVVEVRKNNIPAAEQPSSSSASDAQEQS